MPSNRDHRQSLSDVSGKKEQLHSLMGWRMALMLSKVIGTAGDIPLRSMTLSVWHEVRNERYKILDVNFDERVIFVSTA